MYTLIPLYNIILLILNIIKINHLKLFWNIIQMVKLKFSLNISKKKKKNCLIINFEEKCKLFYIFQRKMF